MAAAEYYSQSPGYSPYSPFNSPWSPPSHPQSHQPHSAFNFHHSASSRPPRPSKPSFEPLINHHTSEPISRPQSPFAIFTSLKNWGLPILSLLTSTAALAAIAFILVILNEKPLRPLPLSITLNTYISVLSTISKASLLVALSDCISQQKWLWFREKPRVLNDIQIFDDASRGPAGAVRLVGRVGLGWTSLGCLVIVGSVVMENFVQGVVSFPERRVEVAGIANVGRAQSYDAGLALTTLDSGLLAGSEFAMKAAVYDGLFKPQWVDDLVPECPTGNCTFPLFDSLAVCGKCQDVTSYVINNTPQSNPSSLNGVQNVSYTIPGGAKIGFTVLYEEGNLAQGPSLISTTVLPPNLPKDVLGLQDPLFTLAVLRFPHVQLRIQDGNYFDALPITNECSLYFCVNTYNITVVNTNAETNVTSTWIPELGTPTVGGATDAGNSMEGTPDAVLQRPGDGIEGNHTYWVPAGTLANLKAWLNITVQGTMNTTFSKVDGAIWANDELQVLNVTTDFNVLFEKLAIAMTTYIRSSGLPGSELVDGMAYKVEIFVHVQWAWLSLPCAMVLLGAIFLIVTILKNERNGAFAWKSSSLALLFHGLEGVQRGRGADLTQIRRVARRTRVVLNRGETGDWKLVNSG